MMLLLHRFLSLAGMGDLFMTCGSENSRNFTVGRRLGQGEDLKYILETLGSTAEGVETVKAAHELLERIEVKAPIAEAVYDLLYGDMKYVTLLHVHSSFTDENSYFFLFSTEPTISLNVSWVFPLCPKTFVQRFAATLTRSASTTASATCPPTSHPMPLHSPLLLVRRQALPSSAPRRSLARQAVPLRGTRPATALLPALLPARMARTESRGSRAVCTLVGAGTDLFVILPSASSPA